METLTKHNSRVKNASSGVNPLRPNGIACDKCGEELADTRVMIFTDPPQFEVQCGCGFKGYRY